MSVDGSESREVGMNLRCWLLSLLNIHHPDCGHCNAHDTCGEEMRKRLEELNWRTNPRSPNDSKPGEIIARQHIGQ